MARGFSKFSMKESETNFNYGSSSNSSNNNNDAGNFECNICLELAQDPIVTLCGHLYCWPCLYEWLHVHSHASECPVCKALIEEDRLVPLYGRGKTSTDPRSKSRPGVNIPHRPTGQRPATAPPPEVNHFPHVNMNPWFMGGVPMASTRFGNYSFSAAIGGLFPLLNFQVHGFPDASAYGPVPGPAAAAAAAAGYPYGYGHSFHGGHAHAHGFPRQMVQGQQLDNYLKALLFMIVKNTKRKRKTKPD